MSDVPLYQRIYNDYAKAIKSGRLLPGQRLPSEEAIANIYSVSRITSKRAMEQLRDDGYIERTPGRGSFVLNLRKSLQSTVSTQSQMPKPHLAKPVIGLLIPDFSESYGTDIVSGVEQAAREHNHNFMLRRSLNSRQCETQAIEDFHEAGCAGIVLMPQHNDFLNDRILRLIIDEYPIVIIDRIMRGIDATFIASDNYDASFTVTQRLLGLGHQEIAFIGYPTDSASSLEQRFHGFMQAFYQEKLFWNESLKLDSLIENASEPDIHLRASKDMAMLREFILENPSITAIYATEYNFAQMAVEVVRELGLRIPQDISVVGYDGPSSTTGNPFLSRVLQPQEAMGKMAVDELMKLVKRETESKSIKLPSTFFQGRSLGPVRAGRLIEPLENNSTIRSTIIQTPPTTLDKR